MKIGIILSTTRQGRVSEAVGKWLLESSKKYSKSQFEIIDLREYILPFYGDEDTHNHIPKWQAKLAQLDGYIFALAEYNHSIPGVLKNALDYAGRNMSDKAAAIVSYGAAGGARSTEHLRGVLGQTNTADIATHILLSVFYDFDENKNFKPLPLHDKNLEAMFTTLDAWSQALKQTR